MGVFYIKKSKGIKMLKLDWESILKNHPNAFHKYHEYRYGDCAYEKGKYPPIELKELKQSMWIAEGLAQFFDDMNIYVIVGMNMFMMFDWRIVVPPSKVFDGLGKLAHSDCDYNSRSNAKKDAFMNAFKILEKILEGK